jgi:hypothetical protein
MPRTLLIIGCLLAGAAAGYGWATLRHREGPLSEAEFKQLSDRQYVAGALAPLAAACGISVHPVLLALNEHLSDMDLTADQRRRLGRQFTDGYASSFPITLPMNQANCDKTQQMTVTLGADLMKELTQDEQVRVKAQMQPH